MKYRSIEKMPPNFPKFLIKVHFTWYLTSRDLRRFRPPPRLRMFIILVRSVLRKEKDKAGMKMTFSLVFGINMAIKSVFGDNILDENYCRLLFFSEPIGTHFDSDLPKFGVNRLRLGNYDGRRVIPPHSPMFHQKSTVTAKTDHLGRFKPFSLVQMLGR